MSLRKPIDLRGERVLHRILGVGVFGWLLERSGWNRNNAYLPTSLTRDRLRLRADAARGGIGAHGFCFAIHVLLSAVALFSGHWRGALWILLPGVFIHLYPVLLQRSILLRLQPLLERSSRWQLLHHLALFDQRRNVKLATESVGHKVTVERLLILAAGAKPRAEDLRLADELQIAIEAR